MDGKSKWYESKLFIYPMIGLAGLVGGSIILDDSSTIESVQKSYVDTVVAPDVKTEEPNVSEPETPKPAVKKEASKTYSSCHPSYSGCLDPNASDYDCSGGSGNGPKYTGRVQVYGSDPFGLDRDGNGWGCE